MNITQLSYRDVAGGSEQVALDLHRAYRDLGHDATLFVGTQRDATNNECSPLPNEHYQSRWAQGFLRKAPDIAAAQNTSGALFRRRALQTLANPQRALRKALGYDDYHFPATRHISELTSVAPEVCHLHNPATYFDMRALPELSCQLPLVFTAHNIWTGTGRCTYPLACTRWRTGCGSCPHQDYPPTAPFDRTRKSWLTKAALYNRSLLYLTSPAAWALRELEQSIMAAGVVEARVIPNGVDQSIFYPAAREEERRELRARLGLQPDDFALAYTAISTGNPYKDPGTLGQALDLLAPAGRRIVLMQMGAAGDTVADEGMITKKTFAFTSDRRELAATLQACDLYVHSARAEVAPLAILEAESCGLPVVASDVGGVRECVPDGPGALLVPACDAPALAHAIECYLSEPVRTRALGAEMADWAAGRLSHLLMAERYLAFYEDAQRSFARQQLQGNGRPKGGSRC
ncbi:MAG: glycosyltransferase [Coriobacteriia bacterium]|nr:glycosyltransferase [Coriobacteriia bacterium]